MLVLRKQTERPEAVETGTVKLVGTDIGRIVRETTNLLDCPDEYERMSRIHNPYGDGHASERIEAALRDYWKCSHDLLLLHGIGVHELKLPAFSRR